MTTEKRRSRTRAAALLISLALAVSAFAAPALADDQDLIGRLPGQWTYAGEAETAEGEAWEASLVLSLGADGTMTLDCADPDGKTVLARRGTWSAELVEDDMDRLTLRFDEAEDGSAPAAECGYRIYSEGWMEENVLVKYLILEGDEGQEGSPFAELFGYDSAALCREFGPNMRVVNCKEFVSLRQERSARSARLAKVPLGALVFAFPEFGEEGGFILCTYRDQTGYILAEYLEPAE